MAYAESNAAPLRQQLSQRNDVTERKMFGGLAFMVSGHMSCGVNAADYMYRVGPGHYEDALSLQDVRPCDFTGRPMKGMVMLTIDRATPETHTALSAMSLDFIAGLPPK